MSDDQKEGLNRELLQELQRSVDTADIHIIGQTPIENPSEPPSDAQQLLFDCFQQMLAVEAYRATSRISALWFGGPPESPHDRAVREQKEREFAAEQEKRARRAHLRVVK